MLPVEGGRHRDTTPHGAGRRPDEGADDVVVVDSAAKGGRERSPRRVDVDAPTTAPPPAPHFRHRRQESATSPITIGVTIDDAERLATADLKPSSFKRRELSGELAPEPMLQDNDERFVTYPIEDKEVRARRRGARRSRR